MRRFLACLAVRLAVCLAACLTVCLLASGCLATPMPIPTTSSIEMGQTAQYLTKNAPPAGFESGVQFPRIDLNLSNLSNWRYVVSLSFDGVYSGTQDKAQGAISAEVFSNELAGERRVLLKASGTVFGPVERNREAVRISNDYYLVDENKVCTKVTESNDKKVADLSAGDLVGGIKKAIPVGQKKTTENKIDIWEYTFAPSDVVLPALQLSEGGKFTIAAGDLWVAPSARAVYEYTITLNVDNAILQGDRQLTGSVRATYQLVETGVPYNISIPNGC
jgi:hypothetical protein